MMMQVVLLFVNVIVIPIAFSLVLGLFAVSPPVGALLLLLALCAYGGASK